MKAGYYYVTGLMKKNPYKTDVPLTHFLSVLFFLKKLQGITYLGTLLIKNFSI